MKSPKLEPKWLMYSSMGLELGLSVVVGLVIGSYLDDWLGTGPWLLLLFAGFGIVAGYRSVFRLWKRVNRDKDEEESPPSP